MERFDRSVRRSVWLTGLALVVTLPLPWATGLANRSYLLVTAVAILAALLLAGTEPREARPVFIGLFGISLLLHQITHLALFWLATAVGGPFLGPDSTSYLERSGLLADLGFPGDMFLASNFGTYDLAHLYVFGAAMEYLDADLFCLQVLNGSFMALVAGLTYSWSRTILPRRATIVGAVVALFPSLVVLSSIDLLKDPSVTFSLVLGVWALVKLTEAQSWTMRAVYIAAGALGLSYVHMARFYLLTHLEMATLFVLLLVLLRLRRTRTGGLVIPRGPAASARLVVSVLLLFGLAEVGPLIFGWPLSPSFYLSTVRRSAEEPRITQYDPGLVEELARRGSDRDRPESSPAAGSTRGTGAPQETPPISSRTGHDALQSSPPSEGEPPDTFVDEPALDGEPESSAAPPPDRDAALSTLTLLKTPMNLIRRFFGPFVWILPEDWTARHILTRDFLYFPGTLIWYFAWPLIAAGLAVTGWRFVQGRSVPLALAILAVYGLLSLAQYALLNLSYRQRDTLFPILAVFAVLGLSAFREYRWFRYAYGGYWLLLLGIAVTHLFLRSWLAG